jgi:hypothetical protein
MALMSRARTTVQEPVAGGTGVSDVRERQAQREATERYASPEWLKFTKLLDNAGAGYPIDSGAALTIAHGLGRRHKGAWLASCEVSVGTATVNVLRSDHASFDSSLIDTHVQLVSDSADEATVKVVVF